MKTMWSSFINTKDRELTVCTTYLIIKMSPNMHTFSELLHPFFRRVE